MRQCANAIVDELYDDLKSKVISAIGNDQIVPKCLAATVKYGWTNNDMERLIERVTRIVVEKAFKC